MNQEETAIKFDALKPLDKSGFIESNKSISSFNYKKLVKSTAIIAIYSAAAVATSTGLIYIPNLETISIFIFLVSFYYGFRIGLPMMLTTAIIFELFASVAYGLSGPVFFFKLVAYLFNVLVASNIAKVLFDNYGTDEPKELKSATLQRIGFAIVGIFLTLIFDLITTLSTYLFLQNIESFVIFFVTGIPLMMFHELTNGIIFFFIPDYVKLINLSSTSKISVSN